MNRNEFLSRLKGALEEGGLNAAGVQRHMQYYREYIGDEMRKGRSEHEVMEELGDPWVIAKTLTDTPGTEQDCRGPEETYVHEQNEDRTYRNGVHVFGLDKWWKKLLLVLILVGIVMIIFAVITGIVALLIPVVVPVLCIIILIRILTGRNR